MGEFWDMVKYVLGQHFGIEPYKPDQYDENNAQNWKLTQTEVSCAVHTRGRFKLDCTFVVWIEKVDPVEFRCARMLQPGRTQELAHRFITSRLIPLHHQTGYYAYEFAGLYQYLGCPRYHFRITDAREKVAVFDPNACDLCDAAKDQVMTANGCKVWLFHMKSKNMTTYAEENYAMLTNDQRKDATEHHMYRVHEEIAVVAALKRKADLERYVNESLIDTTYENKSLIVTIKGAHGQAIIEWRHKRKAEGTVLGSRLGVSLDGPGQTIINHNRPGRITEDLPLGQVCNYRVRLAGVEDDDIQFQIRFPTAAEQEHLARTLLDLEGFRQRQRAPQLSRREQLKQQILDRLGEINDLARVKEELLAEARMFEDEDERERIEQSILAVVAEIEGSQPI